MNKLLIVLLCSVLSFQSWSQGRSGRSDSKKIISLDGSEYVVFKADKAVKSGEKGAESKTAAVNFVNCSTGSVNLVTLQKTSRVNSIEQIVVPSLQLNKVLIIGQAQVEEVKGAEALPKSGSKASRPEPRSNRTRRGESTTIFISDANGSELKQIAPEGFSLSGWSVNEKTGMLLVKGSVSETEVKDKPRNKEQQILIIDLKTGKLRYTI
jgi:hypothetical protein